MSTRSGPIPMCHLTNIEAMEVKVPFRDVAEWCGGTLEYNGRKVARIRILHEGSLQVAEPGDWVIRSTDEGPLKGVFRVVRKSAWRDLNYIPRGGSPPANVLRKFAGYVVLGEKNGLSRRIHGNAQYVQDVAEDTARRAAAAGEKGLQLGEVWVK